MICISSFWKTTLPFVVAPSTAVLTAALREHVAHEIGPIAKPRAVVAVPDLPKTRSGKITRRRLNPAGDRQANHARLGDLVVDVGERVVTGPARAATPPRTPRARPRPRRVPTCAI